MSYRPLKKDLTDGTEICHFCNRPLRSLKAYILIDEKTKENVYSGPKCAEDNINNEYNLKLIPDLTKYTLAINDKESIPSNNSKERNTSKYSEKELNLRKAIEYLELRENKLSEDFNTSYNVLKEYYNSYLEEGTLNLNQISHILNIEKKSPDSLKLINLQKCYNYIFWINTGIQKLEVKADDFLIPIKNYLLKNLKLSDKQKIGVNKWLQNLDGIPQLK
ncbi:hypothetical protein [Cellulophaga baltica]|uniref:Uncharacterized protein n=1 Tax=Cellulophaga baltica 18 TaxID=1348584 RepID=A0AAU8RZA9_9FLAO|nr:hypothetical protein [Cellulophaga baltica]AIZ42465.1 hypothetical protein M666_13295 [Cellulophaga baltica 18]